MTEVSATETFFGVARLERSRSSAFDGVRADWSARAAIGRAAAAAIDCTLLETEEIRDRTTNNWHPPHYITGRDCNRTAR